jgi:hypothetical protein
MVLCPALPPPKVDPALPPVPPPPLLPPPLPPTPPAPASGVSFGDASSDTLLDAHAADDASTNRIGPKALRRLTMRRSLSRLVVFCRSARHRRAAVARACRHHELARGFIARRVLTEKMPVTQSAGPYGSNQPRTWSAARSRSASRGARFDSSHIVSAVGIRRKGTVSSLTDHLGQWRGMCIASWSTRSTDDDTFCLAHDVQQKLGQRSVASRAPAQGQIAASSLPDAMVDAPTGRSSRSRNA